MPEEILLLTGEVEGPHLAAILNHHNPGLPIVHAATAEDLQAALGAGNGIPARRLVAFCTGVVVPGALLEALPGPAYNFHPGPPTYPGSCASSFAVYEAATRFGATLHVMEQRVDEGAIIAVDWFDLPAGGIRYDEVEVLAFQACLRLFEHYAGHLAKDDAPLPASSETWSGRKRTKAEAAVLREPPPDASEEEIRRRFRAFGS